MAIREGNLLAMRSMTMCKLILSALLLACAAGCGDDDATTCDVHADCTNSKESFEAGRCGPTAACVNRECVAWCPQHCGAEADTETCEDGYVCTEPMRGTAGRAICSATEIECEDAAQCPKDRPGAGEWTCEDQVCRFPGFSYLYPQP